MRQLMWRSVLRSERRVAGQKISPLDLLPGTTGPSLGCGIGHAQGPGCGLLPAGSAHPPYQQGEQMTHLDAQVRAQLGQQAAAEVLRLAADVAPHGLVGPRQPPRHELVQRPAHMEYGAWSMEWQSCPSAQHIV